nr:MAG: hypothetical protein GNV1_gp1 [Guiyang Nidovirales-like virus 1]
MDANQQPLGGPDGEIDQNVENNANGEVPAPVQQPAHEEADVNVPEEEDEEVEHEEEQADNLQWDDEGFAALVDAGNLAAPPNAPRVHFVDAQEVHDQERPLPEQPAQQGAQAPPPPQQQPQGDAAAQEAQAEDRERANRMQRRAEVALMRQQRDVAPPEFFVPEHVVQVDAGRRIGNEEENEANIERMRDPPPRVLPVAPVHQVERVVDEVAEVRLAEEFCRLFVLLAQRSWQHFLVASAVFFNLAWRFTCFTAKHGYSFLRAISWILAKIFQHVLLILLIMTCGIFLFNCVPSHPEGRITGGVSRTIDMYEHFYIKIAERYHPRQLNFTLSEGKPIQNLTITQSPDVVKVNVTASVQLAHVYDVYKRFEKDWRLFINNDQHCASLATFPEKYNHTVKAIKTRAHELKMGVFEINFERKYSYDRLRRMLSYRSKDIILVHNLHMAAERQFMLLHGFCDLDFGNGYKLVAIYEVPHQHYTPTSLEGAFGSNMPGKDAYPDQFWPVISRFVTNTMLYVISEKENSVSKITVKVEEPQKKIEDKLIEVDNKAPGLDSNAALHQVAQNVAEESKVIVTEEKEISAESNSSASLHQAAQNATEESKVVYTEEKDNATVVSPANDTVVETRDNSTQTIEDPVVIIESETVSVPKGTQWIKVVDKLSVLPPNDIKVIAKVIVREIRNIQIGFDEMFADILAKYDIQPVSEWYLGDGITEDFHEILTENAFNIQKLREETAALHSKRVLPQDYIFDHVSKVTAWFRPQEKAKELLSHIPTFKTPFDQFFYHQFHESSNAILDRIVEVYNEAVGRTLNYINGFAIYGDYVVEVASSVNVTLIEILELIKIIVCVVNIIGFILSFVFQKSYNFYNLSIWLCFFHSTLYALKMIRMNGLQQTSYEGVLLLGSIFVCSVILFLHRRHVADKQIARVNHVLAACKELESSRVVYVVVFAYHVVGIVLTSICASLHQHVIAFFVVVESNLFQSTSWFTVNFCGVILLATYIALKNTRIGKLKICKILMFIALIILVYLARDLWRFFVTVVIVCALRTLMCISYHLVTKIFHHFLVWGLDAASGDTSEDKKTNIAANHVMSTFKIMMVVNTGEYINFIIVLPFLYSLCFYLSFVNLIFMAVTFLLTAFAIAIWLTPQLTVTTSEDKRIRKFDVTYYRRKVPDHILTHFVKEQATSFLRHIGNITQNEYNNKFNEQSAFIDHIRKSVEKDIANNLATERDRQNYTTWAMDYATREATRRTDLIIRALGLMPERARPEDFLAALLDASRVETPNYDRIRNDNNSIVTLWNQVEPMPMTFDHFAIPGDMTSEVLNYPNVAADTEGQAAHIVAEKWLKEGRIEEREMPRNNIVKNNSADTAGTGNWNVTAVEVGRKQIIYDCYNTIKTRLYPAIREYIASGGLNFVFFFSLPDEESINNEFKRYLIDNNYVDFDEKDIVFNQSMVVTKEIRDIRNFVNEIMNQRVIPTRIPEGKALAKIIKEYTRNDKNSVFKGLAMARDVFCSYGMSGWQLPESKIPGIEVCFRYPDVYFAERTPPGMMRLLLQRKVEVCMAMTTNMPNYVIGHPTSECHKGACKQDKGKYVLEKAWVQAGGPFKCVFFNYGVCKKMTERGFEMERDLFLTAPIRGKATGNVFIAKHGNSHKLFTAAHVICTRKDGRDDLVPGKWGSEPDLESDTRDVYLPTSYCDDIHELKNNYGVTFIGPDSFKIRNVHYGEIKIKDYEIRGEVLIADLPNNCNICPENPTGPVDITGDFSFLRINVIGRDWKIHRMPVSIRDGKIYYNSVPGDSGAPLFCNGRICGVHLGGYNSGLATQFAEIDERMSFPVKQLAFSGLESGQQFGDIISKDKRKFERGNAPSFLMVDGDKVSIAYPEHGRNGMTEIVANRYGDPEELRKLLMKALKYGGKIIIENGIDKVEFDNLLEVDSFADIQKVMGILHDFDEGYASETGQVLVSKETYEQVAEILGICETDQLMTMDDNELTLKLNNIKSALVDIKKRVQQAKLKEAELQNDPKYLASKEAFEDELRKYLEGKAHFMELMEVYIKSKKDVDEKKKAILNERDDVHKEIKKLMLEARQKAELSIKPYAEKMTSIKEKLQEAKVDLDEADKTQLAVLQTKINKKNREKMEIDQEIICLKKEMKCILEKANKAPKEIIDGLQQEKKETSKLIANINETLSSEMKGLKAKMKEATDKADAKIKENDLKAPVCPPKPVWIETAEVKPVQDEILGLLKQQKNYNKKKQAIEKLLKDSIQQLESKGQSWSTMKEQDSFAKTELAEIMTYLFDASVGKAIANEFVDENILRMYKALCNIADLWQLPMLDDWKWAALCFEKVINLKFADQWLYYHMELMPYYEDCKEEVGYVQFAEHLKFLRQEVDAIANDDLPASQKIIYTMVTPLNMRSPAYTQNVPSFCQPCAVMCAKCGEKFVCKQDHLNQNTGTWLDQDCTLHCYDAVLKRKREHDCPSGSCSPPDISCNADPGFGLDCAHKGQKYNVRLCPLCQEEKRTTCVNSNAKYGGTSLATILNGHTYYIKGRCLAAMLLRMTNGHEVGKCTGKLSVEDTALAHNMVVYLRDNSDKFIKVADGAWLDIKDISTERASKIEQIIESVIPILTVNVCPEPQKTVEVYESEEEEDEDVEEEDLNNFVNNQAAQLKIAETITPIINRLIMQNINEMKKAMREAKQPGNKSAPKKNPKKAGRNQYCSALESPRSDEEETVKGAFLGQDQANLSEESSTTTLITDLSLSEGSSQPSASK